MSEVVSFPGLGLDLEMSRVAFTLPGFLGSRPVFWYGILISLGLLAGLFYFFRRTKEFGLNADRSMDVLLVGIVAAVIGARLYYVIFSWEQYKGDLIRILYVWEGGIAIYGSIIGAFLGGALMCKIRKVKFLPTADLAAGSLLLGQAIGRWGNFVNIEAFGSNTNAPWGMTSPSVQYYLTQHTGELARLGVEVDPMQPVHPTFLYESIWCLIGFFFILLFTKRRRFDGQLTLIYLAWYGIGRFFIEGLRTDSLVFGAIRVSQILAMLCFIAATFTLIFILSRIKREGDDEYLKLYALTEEGKQAVSGEYYKQFDKKKNGDAQPELAEAEEKEKGAEDSEETAGEADVEIQSEGSVNADKSGENEAGATPTEVVAKENEDEEEDVNTAGEDKTDGGNH